MTLKFETAAPSFVAGRRATPPPGAPLRLLLDGAVRPGRVDWIGVRPARHASVLPRDEVRLALEGGAEGDHYGGRSGTRQVSLIAAEALDAIAGFLGRAAVSPEELRRNVVVRGINLLALKDRRFTIGDALLEFTGECHPCSRMEQILGPGGYNAVRGQGGILARVLRPGTIRRGDAVSRVELDPAR